MVRKTDFRPGTGGGTDSTIQPNSKQLGSQDADKATDRSKSIVSLHDYVHKNAACIDIMRTHTQFTVSYVG